jgi:hypothetical protein
MTTAPDDGVDHLTSCCGKIDGPNAALDHEEHVAVII